MLSHDRIWTAIDRLAALNDLTPSGLAKRAGLDSTTFNKSKRFAQDGRPRWPSTESIAKIIEATGSTMEIFTGLVNPSLATRRDSAMLAFHKDDHASVHALRHIPVLGMAQAGAGGFFDEAGFPVGEGWDEVAFPGEAIVHERAYALEISGDSMLPLYRSGDRIIVTPDASVRKGDRVVVKTRDGEVMAKILKRQTSYEVVLESVNPDHEDRVFAVSDVDWMARIVWASQ